MFVYILACRDGSLYTGWTDHLDRRLQSHRDGRAAKYTRSRLPVRLVAWIRAEDASQAKSLEARFKQLSRPEKLAALAAGQAFGVQLHKAP
jgi:putative endonuclease